MENCRQSGIDDALTDCRPELENVCFDMDNESSNDQNNGQSIMAEIKSVPSFVFQKIPTGFVN